MVVCSKDCAVEKERKGRVEKGGSAQPFKVIAGHPMGSFVPRPSKDYG